MTQRDHSNVTSPNSISNLPSMIGPIALAVAIFSSFLFSGTSYGEFIILGIAVYIIGIFILNRSEYPYSRLHIVIYLFFVYIVLNPFWSIDFSQSLLHILTLCQVPLIFLLFSNKKIQRSWASYLLFLAIPAFISSVWGIAEYIQAAQSSHMIIELRIDGFLRDANSYAAIQYIFSILIFSLIYCHTPEKPLIRGIIWFIQLLVITALFLTLSRSGILLWLLFVATIFIYSLIKRAKNPWKHIVLPIIIALLSFALIKIMIHQFDQPLVRHGLPDGLTSISLNGRDLIWKPTLKLIEERPLFGWGLKTFTSLYSSVRQEFQTTGNSAHNDYLQFSLEGGVVLLLFLLLFLGYHLYLFIKLITWSRSKLDDIAGFELAMMLFANIALLLHSITNFSFYILQLCILSGMIFARSYYLSANIGLIKQPTLVYFTKTRRGIMVLLLSAIIFTILYRAISGFLFIAPERHAITRSLSTNMSLLNTFAAISPLDHASSTRIVAVLTSHLNAASDIETKKKILDYSISILEPITKAYPYYAINYANLGNILNLAYTQLPAYKENYKHYADLWKKSVEINPVYLPPYLKLYNDLVSKKQYQEAFSLLERLVPWFNNSKLSRENVSLIQQLLISLAEQTDNGLLPLYKQLFKFSNEGDVESFNTTLYVISQRRMKRENAPSDHIPLLPENRILHPPSSVGKGPG